MNFLEVFCSFQFWKYRYVHTVLLSLERMNCWKNTAIHKRKTFVSYSFLIVHALIYCNTFLNHSIFVNITNTLPKIRAKKFCLGLCQNVRKRISCAFGK